MLVWNFSAPFVLDLVLLSMLSHTLLVPYSISIVRVDWVGDFYHERNEQFMLVDRCHRKIKFEIETDQTTSTDLHILYITYQQDYIRCTVFNAAAKSGEACGFGRWKRKRDTWVDHENIKLIQSCWFEDFCVKFASLCWFNSNWKYAYQWIQVQICISSKKDLSNSSIWTSFTSNWWDYHSEVFHLNILICT